MKGQYRMAGRLANAGNMKVGSRQGMAGKGHNRVTGSNGAKGGELS